MDPNFLSVLVSLSRFNISGKQVFYWLSQGHRTALYQAAERKDRAEGASWRTALYQAGERKDKAEGASWGPSSFHSGRAGTWFYCPTKTAHSEGQGDSLQGNQSMVGK